jgi:hypothetical protein
METKTEARDLARRFQSLIARYAELRKKETSRLWEAVKILVPHSLAARQQWAKSQRKTADDFNLFEVMGRDYDEVCHSKILAWLLDRRIEKGTHAQGNLGLRLFLKELERDLRKEHPGDTERYADESYWVRCEVAGDQARVDIEIAARGKFLIHIENKIGSPEGDSQTDREREDLERRAKDLAVPVANCHAIFLTLDGRKASNEAFRPVRWSRIANVFGSFADLAGPPEVRLFASHYAKAVRKLSAADSEQWESENADV